MLEIRFHGRGGQGTVVASILLAKAYFSAGYYVQSFPLFGVERRGAPVEAYLRLDKKKILIRSNVYTPDHIIVQDANLLENVDVTKGLKPEGWIVLNAVAPPENLKQFSGYRLAYVDATRIALEHHLGTRTQPIINTAMLGALAGVMGAPPMDMISEAIQMDIPNNPSENVKAAQTAYKQVQRYGLVN
ncbi:MAG: 2-oxoacid:acceptor oxidoreductase family protein [Desulfobacterales bacterium]|jgi:pyruvate ferredoxin oxidoreductase gamma subunit/2-oxoisovalerate ferredoxin oxidoreductase gamma subunit